nr:C40 family peptidase [Burkholderia ubonensis]
MIESKIREDIAKHALACYPEECCGVVVAGQYFPCRNNAPAPLDDFAISPEDYAAAEDIGPIEAVVHSHPGASAQPSQADLTACEAREAPKWIIVSLGVQADGSIAIDDWCEFAPSGYEAPLIGCEFSHGSNDCYGLVRRYYKQERGVILPDFLRAGEWWKDGSSDLYTQHYKEAGFISLGRVAEPLKGDVLLMKIRSPNDVPNHAAVYTGNDEILHHLWGELSRRDTLPRYQPFVTDVLRYKE